MSWLNSLPNDVSQVLRSDLNKTKNNYGILITPTSEEFIELTADTRVSAILSTTINWCRFILYLIPLTIEDSKNSFYHSVNISSGIKKSKELFRNFLHHLKDSQYLPFFQFFSTSETELNEEEIILKWESLNADSVTDFHIFLMAHMCERTIIVAEKNNSAIYLPILITKQPILNNPILLAVNNGKYNPLVFTDDGSEDPYQSAVFPLTDDNYNQFRIPFINENNYVDTLKKYLFLTTVLNTNCEGIHEIYAVKMRKPRIIEHQKHEINEMFKQMCRNLQDGNREEFIKLHKNIIVKSDFEIIEANSITSPKLIEMDNDNEENLYDEAPDMETDDMESDHHHQSSIQALSSEQNIVPKSFNDQPSSPGDHELDDHDSLLEGGFVSSIVNSEHALTAPNDNEELSSNSFVGDARSTLVKQKHQGDENTSSQEHQEDTTRASSLLNNTHESQPNNSTDTIVHDSPNHNIATSLNETETVNYPIDISNSLEDNVNQRNFVSESYEADQPNSHTSDLSQAMESLSSQSDLRSIQSRDSNDFSSLPRRSFSKFPAGAEIVVKAKNHIVVTGVSNATDEQPIGLFLRETYGGRTVKAFVRISKSLIPEIFVNIHGKVETNYSRTDEDKVTMSLHFVGNDTAVFVGIVPKVYRVKTNRNEKNVAPGSGYSSAFRHTEDHDEDDTATIQNNPLKCKIDGCNRLGVPQHRGLCDNCIKDWQETRARRGIETPSSDMMCLNHHCNHMGNSRFHGYCESCFNTRRQ